MIESNKIDFPEDRLQLYSKLSIFLVSVLISPVLGSYLYCANLRRSGQKDKIFGTVTAILIITFITKVPFMGFRPNNFALGFTPVMFLFNGIVALLMIGPFWKGHFGNNNYHSIIPWSRIILLLSVFITIQVYHYWIGMNYSAFNPAPLYIIRFTTLTILPALFIILLARIIYLTFRHLFRIKAKLSTQ
jgi:hypothetical protein